MANHEATRLKTQPAQGAPAHSRFDPPPNADRISSSPLPDRDQVVYPLPSFSSPTPALEPPLTMGRWDIIAACYCLWRTPR